MLAVDGVPYNEHDPGVKVPQHIAAAARVTDSLGLTCVSDGTVTRGFESGWGGGAYPPPGYVPWRILEVGNGDTYGYYWPIGLEHRPPIVCTIMHDAWAMLPIASSLETCVRLLLRCDCSNVGEIVGIAQDFQIDLQGIPISREEDTEPSSLDGPPWTDAAAGGIEFWGAPSTKDLLACDPGSPHARLIAAKEAIAERKLDEAEDQLKAALGALPEYSDAMALLAQVYRQQQNHGRLATLLMEAITSPLCFGARDRRKLLHWLQRINESSGAASGDPLWERRHGLTFTEGVRENDDYRIFEELIDEYHRHGMGVRAVRLRILTGELMGAETVSFRERCGWTKETYPIRLRADLERAGLQERLPAV